MNLTRLALTTSLATAASSFAAFAQVAADPSPPPAPPGVNASVALNNGGNPAAAIGAASLNADIVPNSAPLIIGNAGTTGVNGLTGSNAAAGSVHGTDVPAIPAAESIGMRRERLHGAAQSSSSESVAADVALGSSLAAGSIRSASLDARPSLATQVQQNIEAGRRAMTAAETQARSLDPDARTQFEAAARAVSTAERRLQQSISAAQSAPSSEWARAREALAADYDSYTQAVAHAQRVAAAGSARNSTSLDRR